MVIFQQKHGGSLKNVFIDNKYWPMFPPLESKKAFDLSFLIILFLTCLSLENLSFFTQEFSFHLYLWTYVDNVN